MSKGRNNTPQAELNENQFEHIPSGNASTDTKQPSSKSVQQPTVQSNSSSKSTITSNLTNSTSKDTVQDSHEDDSDLVEVETSSSTIETPLEEDEEFQPLLGSKKNTNKNSRVTELSEKLEGLQKSLRNNPFKNKKPSTPSSTTANNSTDTERSPLPRQQLSSPPSQSAEPVVLAQQPFQQDKPKPVSTPPQDTTEQQQPEQSKPFFSKRARYLFSTGLIIMSLFIIDKKYHNSKMFNSIFNFVITLPSASINFFRPVASHARQALKENVHLITYHSARLFKEKILRR